MKRDMDLVRKLLLCVEPYSGGQADLTPLLAEGYNENEVRYHAVLAYKAGLAEGTFVEGGLSEDDPDMAFLTGLTWEGHDFVANARNEKIWNSAKTRVLSTVGTMTLEAMKVALKWAMTKAITGDVEP